MQDGFYNMILGPPYTNLGADYTQNFCSTYLGGKNDSDSVDMVPADDKTGAQQFLLQLVRAPDQYTISIPR